MKKVKDRKVSRPQAERMRNESPGNGPAAGAPFTIAEEETARVFTREDGRIAEPK